jgi:hypothetical protein
MAKDESNRSAEAILWDGSPSQWQNFGWFLICLFIVPIPIAFWKWLKVKSFRITLTSLRLRVRSGVFSKDHEDVELYRIKDWTLRRPFHQRICGKGTVYVLSSDRSSPELTLTWIGHPAAFVEQLRNAVEAVRDSKRVREMDMGLQGGADFDLGN